MRYTSQVNMRKNSVWSGCVLFNNSLLTSIFLKLKKSIMTGKYSLRMMGMGIFFKFSTGNVSKIADVGLFQTLTPSSRHSSAIGTPLPPKNGQRPLWTSPNRVSTCLSISNEPELEQKDFQLGSARDLFTSARNWKLTEKWAEISILSWRPIFYKKNWLNYASKSNYSPLKTQKFR